MHINIKIFIAYLNSKKRKQMIKDFNDSATTLKVLIIIYAVSAQDINLNRCCFRTLMICLIIDITIINIDVKTNQRH